MCGSIYTWSLHMNINNYSNYVYLWILNQTHAPINSYEWNTSLRFFHPHATKNKQIDASGGGPTTILAWAGKDATKFFNEIHKGVKSHIFDKWSGLFPDCSFFFESYPGTLKLTARTWKWMVRHVFFFWVMFFNKMVLAWLVSGFGTPQWFFFGF